MRRHAANRLAQRYGVHRDPGKVVARLVGLVLAGEAKFRRATRGGCSEWEAFVGGRRIRFVWCEATKRVVTVLPERRRGKPESDAA